MNKTVLVIFREGIRDRDLKALLARHSPATVVAPTALRTAIEREEFAFEPLHHYMDAGSIYEASALVQKLSCLRLPDGRRLTKTHIYRNYELWWIYYNILYLASCLPYTQYKRLLVHLNKYDHIVLYEPPYESLFTSYLKGYKKDYSILRARLSYPIPVGVGIQLLLTCISVPLLLFKRPSLMIFTGDKFDKRADFDPRMRLIYEELRQRNLQFVEFVRSLESWKTIIEHALERKRPVIYPNALLHVARGISWFLGERKGNSEAYKDTLIEGVIDPEERFLLFLGMQYFGVMQTDIWMIRITGFLLRIMGIKGVFVPTTTERNLHTIIACKLQNIPTVGILHGVASVHYNVYDFLPTYDGKEVLTVDKYGLWSKWWKDYYTEKSNAYRPEQLFISGPMRPYLSTVGTPRKENENEALKVLFVSEQLAVPEEVVPYLEALLAEKGLTVNVSFRPYRDGFEVWLQKNRPDVLAKIGQDHIIRTGIKEALSTSDVVVGTHSTAVLEALFELKPIVFFKTNKWGDYFSLKEYPSDFQFYVEDIHMLIESVKVARKIPVTLLKDLQDRFFGNPRQNGSKWVIDELEKYLRR